MNKEIQVIPAIIPEDFENLEFELSKVRGKVKRVQIDLTDGIYTPNTSWPFVDSERFEQIVSQEEGMPFWEDFDFDFDLMISNPEQEYQKLISAGASSLIFHLESLKDNKLEFIKKVKEENLISVAVAIKTTTPNSELEPFLDIVDFVQFMGIEKIGYQHQKFDQRVLDKIAELRKLKPDLDIAVDGGVNLDTEDRLTKAGANLLVSGSAILEADDIDEVIEELET
jgi:ribulose-phosphate 3-epimerase